MGQETSHILLAIILLCWIPNALANRVICSEEEARSAEAAVAAVNSWDELYQQFKRYSHCDDGAIAEGFSESISLLLAEQWAEVQLMSRTLIQQPVFQKFLIEHIDETIPALRLECIVKNVPDT
ncbi:MAG: hypothetical protein LZF85_12575 [Nitrosomonas sp.]|uniref:hypothetical protein n=1 Tax=Nitrosomonas sp. TaxID=42353 RepID=UPI0025E45664|nr:hypothetical protein [Nitrosomonas sp.]UJP02582.1 MAG: hypothetical protein LZF85_12575 [Nitrosomonas sp.]